MCTKVYRKFNLRKAVNLFALFLFILPFNVNAQKTSFKQETTLDWQLDAVKGGVQFYHAIKVCDDRKVVFLKFNNTNKYKVEITWKEEFTTQQEQKIEGYSRQENNIILGLGETKETDCRNPSQKELLILPEQINPSYIAVVSKFDYKEITVAQVK